MTHATPRRSVVRAAASPAAHHVDVAPQLVVVGLAHAALVAVARALDVAHPALGTLPGREPSSRASAESFASQILELTARCADQLHDYAVAVECEIEGRLDDDLF
jgi:hypothetical protein